MVRICCPSCRKKNKPLENLKISRRHRHKNKSNREHFHDIGSNNIIFIAPTYTLLWFTPTIVNLFFFSLPSSCIFFQINAKPKGRNIFHSAQVPTLFSRTSSSFLFSYKMLIFPPYNITYCKRKQESSRYKNEINSIPYIKCYQNVKKSFHFSITPTRMNITKTDTTIKVSF